jgi:hypothetical protein
MPDTLVVQSTFNSIIYKVCGLYQRLGLFNIENRRSAYVVWEISTDTPAISPLICDLFIRSSPRRYYFGPPPTVWQWLLRMNSCIRLSIQTTCLKTQTSVVCYSRLPAVSAILLLPKLQVSEPSPMTAPEYRSAAVALLTCNQGLPSGVSAFHTDTPAYSIVVSRCLHLNTWTCHRDASWKATCVPCLLLKAHRTVNTNHIKSNSSQKKKKCSCYLSIDVKFLLRRHIKPTSYWVHVHWETICIFYLHMGMITNIVMTDTRVHWPGLSYKWLYPNPKWSMNMHNTMLLRCFLCSLVHWSGARKRTKDTITVGYP